MCACVHLCCITASSRVCLLASYQESIGGRNLDGRLCHMCAKCAFLICYLRLMQYASLSAQYSIVERYYRSLSRKVQI